MKRTLEELARLLDVRLQGEGRTEIDGMAGIDDAREGDLTFVANLRYRKKLRTTLASAAIVASDITESRIPLLVSPTPYLTFAKALRLFYPESRREPFIAQTAWIDPSARLGRSVTVHPFVHVGKGAWVGSTTVLYPFVYVGERVRVGEDCRIHSHVSIRDGCIVGNRVVLHNGVVVGADGFGFAPEEARHVKIPQVGIVRIEDDVEIGANSCVDRATMGETRIGRGTKIDNLVQVAHNVQIGEDVILVSQVGISGSTVVGDRAVLGGQVGVVGHVRIGKDAKVGAKSGIHSSIRDGDIVSGIPGMQYAHFLKTMGALRRLPQLRERVLHLEKELKALKALLQSQGSPDEAVGAEPQAEPEEDDPDAIQKTKMRNGP